MTPYAFPHWEHQVPSDTSSPSVPEASLSPLSLNIKESLYAAGFEDGFLASEQNIHVDPKIYESIFLRNLDRNVQNLAGSLESWQEGLHIHIAKLIDQALKTLWPAAEKSWSFLQICHILEQAHAEWGKEFSQLTVTIHPRWLRKVKTLCQKKSWNWVVKTDADLALSDVRVCHDYGGLERLSSCMLQAVESVLSPAEKKKA